VAKLSVPEGFVELRSNNRWYRIDITFQRKNVMSGIWFEVKATAGPLLRHGEAQPHDWSLVLYDGTTAEGATRSLLETVERKMDEGFYIHDRKVENLTVYTTR